MTMSNEIIDMYGYLVDTYEQLKARREHMNTMVAPQDPHERADFEDVKTTTDLALNNLKSEIDRLDKQYPVVKAFLGAYRLHNKEGK